MAADSFYVRARGKVSGPYDVATLQKLVRRGALSRIHEISDDRSSWAAAGEYEDLFPPNSIASEPPQVAASVEVASNGSGTEPAVEPPIPSGSSAQLYFYTQRGSTVGPVPMAVLKSLVENGTLRPDDLVWRENSETGASAGQMPALAPLFGAAGSHRGLDYQSGASNFPKSPEVKSIQTVIAAVRSQGRSVGIAVGTSLFLFIDLPWFSVGSNSDKKFICWWDLFRTPQGNAWGLVVTMLVLAGITCCVVAPLMSGISRAIVYLSLMAATSIFLCTAALSSEIPAEKVLGLTVPWAMSLLVGLCAFRAAAPQSLAGRVMLGVCSGIAIFGMLFGIIASVQDTHALGDVPAGVVFGATLTFFGLLAGLAAGIMGMVGLKPTFTPALNLATGISSAASLVLPGLGIFIAVASTRSMVTCDCPKYFNPWITSPLVRPAAAIARGVVRFRTISLAPTLSRREGPSVKNTALAGTCSERCRRFAAYAPDGWMRRWSRPASALAMSSTEGESTPSCGCDFG